VLEALLTELWRDPLLLALTMVVLGLVVIAAVLYRDLARLRRALLRQAARCIPVEEGGYYETEPESRGAEKPRIGEYTVIEPIAAGGYAWVFKVRDRRNRVWVAKVFMPRDMGEEVRWPPSHGAVQILSRIIGDYIENRRLHDMIRRFFSEVRVVQTVREIVSDEMWWRTILSSNQCRGRERLCEELRRYIRNIINIYDVNKDLVYLLRAGAGTTYYDSAERYVEDPPYVIVEYAEKGSVSNVRDILLSNPRHLLQFFEKVAGAVALYYVSYGGVHCDIKPGNILVIESGEGYEPVVTDFGIARRVSEAITTWSPGTPQYMPPEYLFYPLGRAEPTWDVYSLAATMYHVVTGRIPYAQYLYIAASRHPGIGDELRGFAQKVVESLEATLFGVSMLLPNQVGELVYKGVDISRTVDVDEARRRMGVLSNEMRSGVLRGVRDRDGEELLKAVEKHGLPRRLVDTIMRSLDPDPSRRPSSVVELWAELRSLSRELG